MMIDNFLNGLYGLFVYLVSTVLTAIADFLLAIPVPDFVSSSSASFVGFAGYLANFFHLPYLVSVVMSAYTLRFIIRRIPIIG